MYINGAMWENVKSFVNVAKNYSREILHQRISEDQFTVDSTQYSGIVFLFRTVFVVKFMILYKDL